jgi:selenocysteine lyase/cysteine desulfurase
MSSRALSPELVAAHFFPAVNFLNTAAYGLPPRAVSQALHAIVERWSQGAIDAGEFDGHVTAARASFARLVGVSPALVATDVAVSSLVGVVAASLPRGAEVVVADGDFTSLLFPFLERERAGELSVRSCPLEAVADNVRSGTALVAVSAVQSLDGRICDLPGIASACEEVGARSLIDATQAVGWLPFPAARFDYVVASAYKWLLSPRGTAFMSIKPDALVALRPRGASWYAGDDIWNSIYGGPLRLSAEARRLDISPAWFSWVGCAEALAFIERIGIPAIYDHDLALSATFADRLGRPAPASPIVSIGGDGVFEALSAAGFAVSRRAGATRLSFHLYNTQEQALAAAEIVDKLI